MSPETVPPLSKPEPVLEKNDNNTEKKKEVAKVLGDSQDSQAKLMLNVALNAVFSLVGINLFGTKEQDQNGEPSFFTRILAWFRGEDPDKKDNPASKTDTKPVEVKPANPAKSLPEVSARVEFPDMYKQGEVLLNKLPAKGSDLIVFPAVLKSTQGKEILRIEGERYINSTAALDLIALAAKYREQTNKPLIISSAFRTTTAQEAIYRRRGGANQRGGRYAAPPGESNHNTGHAVDVANECYNSYPGGLDAFEQLAVKFGFNPLERAKRDELKEFGHLNHITSISRSLRSGVAEALTSMVERHDHI